MENFGLWVWLWIIKNDIRNLYEIFILEINGRYEIYELEEYK